jgi:hypothetical protein
MNSNELRIGNWVLYEGKPTKVDEIFIGAFKHLKAEPIELTAEVLEKAGFEKDNNYTYLEYFRNGRCSVDMCKTNSNKGKAGDVDLMHVDGLILPKEIIKNLHQLQNAYYALTGEEINITLC